MVCLSDSATHSNVDGEQNRPCDEYAQYADDDDQLEVAHKQKTVDGGMVQDILIGQTTEISYPAKETFARGGSPASVQQSVNFPYAWLEVGGGGVFGCGVRHTDRRDC